MHQPAGSQQYELVKTGSMVLCGDERLGCCSKVASFDQPSSRWLVYAPGHLPASKFFHMMLDDITSWQMIHNVTQKYSLLTINMMHPASS